MTISKETPKLDSTLVTKLGEQCRKERVEVVTQEVIVRFDDTNVPIRGPGGVVYDIARKVVLSQNDRVRPEQTQAQVGRGTAGLL
jgi:hypothetical protein